MRQSKKSEAKNEDGSQLQQEASVLSIANLVKPEEVNNGVVKRSQNFFKKYWKSSLGLLCGVVALFSLITFGLLGQYYKGRVMPGVSIGGIEQTGQKEYLVQEQVSALEASFSVALRYGEKTTHPTADDIGLKIDVAATVQNAMEAKRRSGLLEKVMFWQERDVPASVELNQDTLRQYVDTNFPEITKPAQDAQLAFDDTTRSFFITSQADGDGPNIDVLAEQIVTQAEMLEPKTLELAITPRKPHITEQSLAALIPEANQIVTRNIILTNGSLSYRATPAEIAEWVTPTPQKNGSIELDVDLSKIQSFVGEVGRRVGRPPVDRKILKTQSGQEMVIQEGQTGIELVDQSVLAGAIKKAIDRGEDLTQAMNVTVAAYKTVTMDSYDKWIEVDLSQFMLIAYENGIPIRSFTVATGMPGWETVTGEFSIWHKTRIQTMTGGSRVNGTYYSVPNVEWNNYFYKDYAIHGAWWRTKFAVQASHGCVNMSNADAEWIYNWAPIGTKVVVHY